MDVNEVVDALLEQMKAEIDKGSTRSAPGGMNTDRVLRMAEAYAWLSRPGQPHGGSSVSVPPKAK